jgi:outer membrane protein assembly factor BamB
VDDNKSLIDNWGKPNKKILSRLKLRKTILLSALGAAVVLIAFFAVFSTTDLIARPIKSLTSLSGAGEWAMFGHDPSHSGATDSAATLPQGIVTKLLSAADEIHSSPAVANGIIYVGSRDYYLYAIDASTGAVRWKFQAGSYVDSSPVVADNTVYFGSNDGKLYALNATTGQKLWDFRTQYAVRSSVAVADGKVYFGADDYNVYALDTVTGKQIWTSPTENEIESNPTVADGLLYIGSADDNFYALDAKTGRLRLKFPDGSIGGFSPAEQNGTVYIGSSGGILYAIEGKARNWPGENQIRPNWQALHIYGVMPAAPNESGYLWSLNLRGTPSLPTRGPPPASSLPQATITSSASLSNTSLFIGMSNKVVAVDLQSHAKIWDFPTNAPVSGTPALSNNMVYAACEDGHLYILDATSGAQLKDVLLGGKLTSSPAIIGSTVYLTSQDGTLFAVK